MNHSRRARLNLVGFRCVLSIVLILASHQVIEVGIGGHHFGRLARLVFLAVLVVDSDTVSGQFRCQTIEAFCFGVDNSRLEVGAVFLGSNKQGIILNMIFQ